MIDTKGLKPADVLCALYNASRPLGMGFRHYNPAPMATDEAEKCLAVSRSFDYLKGRVMKVNLVDPNGFDEWGYDRDNGAGAAQKAIDALRSTGTPDNAVAAEQHRTGTHESGVMTMNRLHQGSTTKIDGNMATLHLGLDDVREELEPHVRDAIKQNKPQ